MNKYTPLKYTEAKHTNSIKIVELEDGQRIGTLVGTLSGWMFHADNGIALSALRMTEIATQLIKLNERV